MYNEAFYIFDAHTNDVTKLCYFTRYKLKDNICISFVCMLTKQNESNIFI